MTDDLDRLPGEPPSHGRNWQPATTPEEYHRNCAEGLEVFSERRLAKLMGMSRIQLYRIGLMAELPDDVFEALLAAGLRSSKAIAEVALALKRGDPYAHDDEHCPHCGYLLRRRRHVSKKAAVAIRKMLTDGTA